MKQAAAKQRRVPQGQTARHARQRHEKAALAIMLLYSHHCPALRSLLRVLKPHESPMAQPPNRTRSGRVCILTSHSRCLRLHLRSERIELSSLRFLGVFCSPSKKIPRYRFNIGHSHFHKHPSQILIHVDPPIQCYRSCGIERTPLN
jgi:hypothetical protein